MIESLIKIGDELVITIPTEVRDTGYNPCPDGTKGIVLGFGEIPWGRIDNLGLTPGFHLDRSQVRLILDDQGDGKVHWEASSRLEMVNQEEYKRRLAGWLAAGGHRSSRETQEVVRDLPDTPFWEGDTVRTPGLPRAILANDSPEDEERYVIIYIDYTHLNDVMTTDQLYPAYHISDRLGSHWHIPTSADRMILVERGNVWKYYHDQPLTFGTLREEAEFFLRLGHTVEVPNPNTGLYAWTIDEVLAAIRQGTVHGFIMRNPLAFEPLISARRFRNEELGQRVAQATLEGYAVL